MTIWTVSHEVPLGNRVHQLLRGRGDSLRTCVCFCLIIIVIIFINGSKRLDSRSSQNWASQQVYGGTSCQQSLDQGMKILSTSKVELNKDQYFIQFICMSIQFYFKRPYSYSQYWTGTCLQWRPMQGNLLKCKYFLIYSPPLASIAS